MANAVPSNPGQRKLSGDEEALFRDIYTGEVLTAYHSELKLADKILTREIPHGKSASFAAVDRASGGYHTAGEEILGKQIAHTDVIVTVDNELISDTFISKIQEAKTHYDVRGVYSQEQGHYLALQEDRNIARMIVKAARGGELFDGDGGGTTLTNANYMSDGSVLADGIYLAKETLESKNVNVEMNDVYAAVLPSQWYLLVRTEQLANRNYNPDADYQKGIFRMIGGVEVIKSTAFPWGRDDTPYDGSTNTDGTVGNPNMPQEPTGLPAKYHLDMTNTAGAVWVKDAVARVNLLGMDLDMTWDPRRRGYLTVAAIAQGMGPVRNKCAVELATA